MNNLLHKGTLMNYSIKIIYTVILFLFLNLLTIPSLLSASVQNDLAEIQKQIEHESAILKDNPNAAPSPKLRELQKKAIQIQRASTTKAMENLDSASKKEASNITGKLIEHKDNIQSAADGAISVMDALNDELSSESTKLKIQIGKITDHRDVSEFLSKAGKSSQDAKRVRALNAKLEQLDQRQNKIKQDKNRLIGAKSLLEKGKTGLDALSMVNNLKDGKYLDGAEDALGIVKDYLPDNSGKIKALDATTKLLAETSGGTKRINQKLGKEMGRLSEYSNKLKRTEKLAKGIDKSLKTIGYIKKAKELVNKAIGYQKQLQDLKDDGTTTEAGRNLIMGMDVVGEGIKGLAGYLPPGASDFVEFYGDAMKLPGTVNKVAKKWYKNRDEAVNVTGPLAQTKAGREYPGILDRDPELNPDGNLGVYYDPERNRHVLITDPDKPAVVISEKERNRLAQINSDLTAAGKKLTNGMITELRKNGYQKIVIPGLLSDEIIDVKDLGKLAKTKREEARIKALAAKALGIKNPSKKDLADYARFDDKLKFSQRLYNYHLTDKQKKNLFAKFQDDPEGFEKFLSNYAKKKKGTALIPQLTDKQKKAKEAENRAKKLGIHSEDLITYYNCLCRDCGGMLGGNYNPDFEGGGQGPCQCNGPLTIWKTPLSTTKETEIGCFNSISQMNYNKNRAIFDKWHREALAENAKSVAKEKEKIYDAIRSGEVNKKEEIAMEMTKLFNLIKGLLLYKDSDAMKASLVPALRNHSYRSVEKGNLTGAIDMLNSALKIGSRGWGNDHVNISQIETQVAKVKKWDKEWSKTKKEYFPKIDSNISKHQVQTARWQVENLEYKMLKDISRPLPPAIKDPAFVARKEKVEMLQKTYNETVASEQKKATTLQKAQDCRAALPILENLLKDWEHHPTKEKGIKAQIAYDKAQVHIAKESAKLGDHYKKNNLYLNAVEQYNKSLKIQKDSIVQRKLNELLEKISSAEQLLAESRKEWNSGNLGKAIKILDVAKDKDPSNKQISKTLKAMQAQKKMMDDSLTESDKLIEKKKFDQAQNILKKAERISNQYPPYVKMLKRLELAKQKEKMAQERKKVEEKIAAEKLRQDKIKKERDEALAKQKALQEESNRINEKKRVEEEKRLAAEKMKADQLKQEQALTNEKNKHYTQGFAGKWNSNYGVMELSVIGIKVRGNYTHDQGRIEAILSKDGKTMKGTWAEAPSYKGSHDAGKMYFTLSSNGTKIKGLWSYGENTPTKSWTATRIGDVKSNVVTTPKSKETVSSSTRVANGYSDIVGKTKTSTSYAPNNKGDVFKGGRWAGASGGSDWIQKDFSTPQFITGISIAKASTDVTTQGFRLTLKLKKANGKWITIDELRDTNINRTALSGGAIGKSIPSYSKKLSPAVKATAFRLEFKGHGWFGASDIRIYSQSQTNIRVLDTAGIDGIVDIEQPINKKEISSRAREIMGKVKRKVKNSPVKIVTSTSFESDVSRSGYKNIVTTKATLSFWNVGSEISGYGEATMDVESVSSLNGSKQEMHYSGTFSGGSNGVFKLSDGEVNITLKVLDGKRVKVDGEEVYFTIPDTSVFQ